MRHTIQLEGRHDRGTGISVHTLQELTTALAFRRTVVYHEYAGIETRSP